MKTSTKKIINDAKSMSAKKFMEIYENDSKLEILDADNLLNMNEGYLNLDYEGISILFLDGEYTD
jgi:hypothetical protein